MATLQQVIDDIQDATGALTGIRAAPDEPTDNAAAYPFVVAFAGTGRYELGSSEMRGLHSVIVQLHVSHTNLPTDVATAMAYAKAIPNAIFSAFITDQLNETAQAIGDISYTFGSMKYGEVDTLGFQFTVEGIKTRDAIS